MLLLSLLGVYARSFSWGLIAWDDHLHLTGNPYLSDPLYFWLHPYGKLYIPLSYNLWSALCTDSTGAFVTPVPLRLANFTLHFVASCLVFRICTKFTADRVLATLGALLFALHPLQVESVAWISELRGLLAGCFSLGAVLLYLAERKRLSLACLALALLSKPSAVAVPFILLAIEWFTNHPSRRELTRRLWPHFVLAGLAAIALPLFLQTAGTSGVDSPLWLRPLVAVDALATYTLHTIFPRSLSADYSNTPARIASLGPRIYFVHALVYVLVAIQLRMHRHLRLPTAIFIAGLIPVLGFVPFEFQRISTVADRYAYLAMLGPAVWVAILPTVSGLFWRRLRPVVIVAVLLLLGMLSYRQLSTWRDDEALWRHAVAVNPKAVVARCNLADIEARRGNVAEAKKLFTQANQLDPARSSPMIGLAKMARESGDSAGAEKLYRSAISSDPTDPIPFADLGSLLVELRRFGEARQVLNEGLAKHPDYANLHQNLAGLKFLEGRREDAMAEARKVIALHPRHARGHLLIAMLTDDERMATLAQRLDPGDPAPTKWLLPRVLARGDFAEAERLARAVVSAEPGDVTGWNNLGRALAGSGRVNEAIAAFERALQLRPDSQALMDNLEAAKKLRATTRPAD